LRRSFQNHCSESGNSYALLGKIKLSRKQYYSRTADFIKAGLVKRKSGKYFLTAAGKIVCNSHTLIEIAIDNYWKLKAIDSLELEALSQEEYTRIVNILMDDNKIKEAIFAEIPEFSIYVDYILLLYFWK